MNDFFDSIKRWSEIAEMDPVNSYIIYGGESEQKRSAGHVLNWKAAGNLITRLEEELI